MNENLVQIQIFTRFLNFCQNFKQSRSTNFISFLLKLLSVHQKSRKYLSQRSQRFLCHSFCPQHKKPWIIAYHDDQLHKPKMHNEKKAPITSLFHARLWHSNYDLKAVHDYLLVFFFGEVKNNFINRKNRFDCAKWQRNKEPLSWITQKLLWIMMTGLPLVIKGRKQKREFVHEKKGEGKVLLLDRQRAKIT